MTFVRKDSNKKGWKPKTGAGRTMQINATSDQKKVMYITLEDVVNLDQEASLMLNEEVKDKCLKVWWLQNNYGCWKHFFRARITWAQAKEIMQTYKNSPIHKQIEECKKVSGAFVQEDSENKYSGEEQGMLSC